MAKTRKKSEYYSDFQYGQRIEDSGPELLKTPKDFDFSKCLNFLARSPLEPCHEVQNNFLFKLEKFDGQMVLMKIGCCRDQSIGIEFLTPRPVKSIRTRAAKYVRHWFDLDTDLRPFYRMAGDDPVLNRITADLYGLRILAIPDLFEAITWAIIGQQINLRFAYTLKKRFVESFGEKFAFHRRQYYLFPTPQEIAALKIADIRGLQFTARKSEYIIELAQKMKSGDLTRVGLLRHKNFDAARKELQRIRGIGQWTADYVSLRCLGDPAAIPLADVGLQNAVKQQLGLTEKPTAEEIYRYSEAWKGWKAYATFYLWASLLNPQLIRLENKLF